MTAERAAEPAERTAEQAMRDLQQLTLHHHRILIVATGSIMVAHLPANVAWIRRQQPEAEIQIVLTRTASQFVSKTALTMIAGRPVLDDVWQPDTDIAAARHVEWSQWAELAVVWPATFHYVARLALGLADSPSLLALHCTRAPVAVAPSLPPGGWESAAMSGHVAALSARPGVHVFAPKPGLSLSTGKDDGWLCQPLGLVLGDLDRRAHQGKAADGQV